MMKENKGQERTLLITNDIASRNGQEMAVYLRLVSLANDSDTVYYHTFTAGRATHTIGLQKGQCRVSLQYLVNALGFSERQVRKALKGLEDNGFIISEAIPRVATRYTICHLASHETVEKMKNWKKYHNKNDE